MLDFSLDKIQGKISLGNILCILAAGDVDLYVK